MHMGKNIETVTLENILYLVRGWSDGQPNPQKKCECWCKFHTLDAGSNKNIKEIEILLKKNWSFPKHIFKKNIERNIQNLVSISFLIILKQYRIII
jgi:hypothetical protein